MKALAIKSSDLEGNWSASYHHYRQRSRAPLEQRIAAFDDYLKERGVPRSRVDTIIADTTNIKQAADEIGGLLMGKAGYRGASPAAKEQLRALVRTLTYKHLVKADRDIEAQKKALRQRRKAFFAAKVAEDLIGS